MTLPFRNPDLPLDARVADLISRLTRDEKISRLFHDSPAIERLGIPTYNWWNETSHGVARAGEATVFPHAIALAASWNRDLLDGVAEVIAVEARAKHHDAARRGEHGMYQGLTSWTPNINIFRDPRWGRGQETFGEDPFLSGELADVFIRTLQGDDPRAWRVAMCAKHYAVHSGPEVGRHAFDSCVDARDLRETYLPAFKASVRAGVAGIMTAYNRLNGVPCSAHPQLLGEILRGEWGFDGYVVSDVGAIADMWAHHKWAASPEEGCAAAVREGCDLNGGWEYGALAPALDRGLLTEEELDRAVANVLRILFRLGLFDPEDSVPWAGTSMDRVCCPEHRALAREAARQSLVLLTNDGILPLNRATTRRIAVVGPNAHSVRVLLGNYHGTPRDPVTLLDGIRNVAGAGIEVLFAEGCHLAAGAGDAVPIPAEHLHADNAPGLRGEYFAAATCGGGPALVRRDDNVAFIWWDQTPDRALPVGQSFSVRWSGTLRIPREGVYRLGVTSDATIRLSIDGQVVANKTPVHGGETKSVSRRYRAGDEVPLVIEYEGSTRAASAHLVWVTPEDEDAGMAAAVEAARAADVVIACVGLNSDLEGEEGDSGGLPGFVGGDRTNLDLPGRQSALLEALAATGTPLVVVACSGSALALGAACDRARAVLLAWYPGEEGGNAVADVLFGDANPAGRLPVTFYRTADDLPPFTDYAMEGRTYRFFRGEPLFPFGHGLSYTRFAVSHLRLAPASVPTDGEVKVAVTVTNEGEREGAEVVQLYVERVDAVDRVPLRALRGFARVVLAPGASRDVAFTLGPEDFSRVTRDGRRVVEPGTVRLHVGGKQPGCTGRADAATTQVLAATITLTGPAREIAP
ncbi:MAG: glycoside hydrolase family 3 C-terminal domain-containing protein [Candidatus Sumerlaeia bacterium]|nr:glycoside hydrolase family 3 C-terminal domain-containing protein [Candidatus Sumerlaeia bacterium]